MSETDPVLNKKKLIQYKEDINTRIKTFLMNQKSGCFQLENWRYKINKKLGLSYQKILRI